MFEESKNSKDTKIDPSVSLRDNSFFLSYSKTSKLITALYMVTDVLDESEPIRHRLRTLGIEIITDTSLKLKNVFVLNKYRYLVGDLTRKIQEVLSLLDIAYSLGMISGMNFNILQTEFITLKKSVGESKGDPYISDILKDAEPLQKDTYTRETTYQKDISEEVFSPKGQSMGQEKTRIGVQRAEDLLKTLSEKMKEPSGKDYFYKSNTPDFNVLKNKRREEIIFIIKNKVMDNYDLDGLTLKEIKDMAKGILVSCGEKTLQRELNSMVTDGILRKTGQKRWSKYSLNNTNAFLKRTKSLLNGNGNGNGIK